MKSALIVNNLYNMLYYLSYYDKYVNNILEIRR